MKLDNNYTLSGDKHNWILTYESEVKTNEKGKEYKSKDQWYFTNINDALKKYCDESLKQSKSVEDLILRVIELTAKIESLWN